MHGALFFFVLGAVALLKGLGAGSSLCLTELGFRGFAPENFLTT
jgi:hypothetical protein